MNQKSVLQWLQFHGYFIVCVITFSCIVLYKAGSIGETYDETADLTIVKCLTDTKNPFNCIDIPSQTRFIYNIHAIGNILFPIKHIDYKISFLAWLFLLISCYSFILKEKDRPTAIIFTLCYCLCIPILCSARMILTHSGIWFGLFNTLFLFKYYEYVVNEKKRDIMLSGTYFGLSLASCLIGVFSAVHLLIILFIFPNVQKSFKMLLCYFTPFALIVFFFSTIIYFDPATIDSAIKEALNGHEYSSWNYLNTGSNKAPWYFSFLLFAVKFTPAGCILLFISYFIIKKEKTELKKFFYSTLLFMLFFFFLKSVIFQYDAPHHQIHIMPLACMLIAISVNQLRLFINTHTKLKPLWIVGLALISWHTVQLFRCYPNLLFYGAQYGTSFIGQFYGPAVFHGQDRGEFIGKLSEIITNNPRTWILRQENSGTRMGDLIALRDMDTTKSETYRYAVLCHLDTGHLKYNDTKNYVDLLQKKYEICYTYYFPWQTPMYSIYQLKKK